jgi:hypothetical protein
MFSLASVLRVFFFAAYNRKVSDGEVVRRGKVKGAG